MEILKTNNISKIYGKNTVLDNVSMTINKGDIYGFIGQNGAGKTTLMRIVLTLAKASSGDIALFGSDDIKAGCKRTGSLIETPALPTGLTAREVIRRYSILYGADINKTDEILELVGLKDSMDKKVGRFSLGMKQRLGIGIALIGEPEFMVLDEPLNGLDPMGMKEVRDLIVKLNQEKEITFLISSHLLEELGKTATKIGIINKGKLLEECSMEDILAKCVRKIVFTLDDEEKALEVLKEAEPELASKVSCLPGKLEVAYDNDCSAKINRILVTAGINVSLIETAGYNLEDYYMEKIGAKDERAN